MRKPSMIGIMKIQLTVVAAIFLAGCTGGTRDCGVFDLPQALSWSTVEAVGESATFTSDSGDNLTLTLLSIENNEPFEAFNREGEDRVICGKFSNRRYMFDDDNTGLFIEITQLAGIGVPFEEQPIVIEIAPEAPLGNSLGNNFFLRTSRLEFYIDGEIVGPTLTRSLTDTEFGGINYDLAIEQIYTDTTDLVAETPGGVNTITALVFAQGNAGVRDGLVRIDFVNGESFTRVN